MRRPRLTIRARLTLTYALLFGVSAAVLMGISWWLISRHLDRTLTGSQAGDALSELGVQYGIALAGTVLLAVGAGWIVAGRALAPLSRITRTARRVSDEHLDERISPTGPDDELRELGETFDSMLDRLAGSFEAQRRFVANASHELRSPLTVIRSEAEVALANPEPDIHELRGMAAAVIEESDRTEKLLEGLLTLARTQRGLARNEPVDLAEIGSAASRSVAGQARDAGIVIRSRFGHVRTNGDPRLLERLAANLLENGLLYNRPDGLLEIETVRRDGRAVLRVRNTGRILSTVDAERIVEPFERLGRHRDGGGAGLGLSIVRSVAEAHGGTLEIAPRSDGGLAIEVVLPCVLDLDHG